MKYNKICCFYVDFTGFFVSSTLVSITRSLCRYDTRGCFYPHKHITKYKKTFHNYFKKIQQKYTKREWNESKVYDIVKTEWIGFSYFLSFVPQEGMNRTPSIDIFHLLSKVCIVLDYILNIHSFLVIGRVTRYRIKV